MIASFDDILRFTGKKLSEEQRRAVFSDRATIVSAGAGSGKTTVLSLRFLRLVYQMKTSSDRILTLTFTRKAAAEMYERIHGLLSAAAKEDDSGYLKRELECNFPKAQISTMDGFWTEIARAGALDYGISRDFSLLAKEDSDEMIERSLEALSEDDNAYEGYMYLSSVMNPEMLLGLLSDISYHIDILTDYNPESAISLYDKFISGLKDMVSEKSIESILSDIEELGDGADPCKSLYKDELWNAISLCKEGRYSELPQFNIRNKPKGVDWEPIKKEIKDEYRVRLKDYKKIALLESNREQEIKVAAFIACFIKLIQKERRSSSMLSFSDIERIAEKTLISNRGIREYYKRRFDYIMIDEFQDNNSKQKDILYLLSEAPGKFSNGIPDASSLDKNKLFFVGDDKQSIYRFRGADVSVFNSLKREVVDKMGGDYLSLSANYRSEPKLVDHFNSIFSSVFANDGLKWKDDEEERMIASFRGAEPEDFFASASSISAGRAEGKVEPVIELDELPIPDWDKGDKPDGVISKSDAESEFIARKIEEIVASDEFNVGDNRPATYEDIAILYSVTKAQMPLEKALRRHNIPYTVMESTSVTVEAMASDFYSFLQLIVYPSDKKSFLTLLKSPFAHLSDKGLQEFLGNDAETFRAFSISPIFEDKADKAAYDSLSLFYEEVKERAESGTIASLVEMLFYDSGYYAYISSDSRLSVYKEHFDYLWALADSADQRGEGLPLFLDSLRPLIGTAEKLSDVTIEALSSRGVSLMTIHKSKGLEFPIVILADSAAASSSEETRNSIVDIDGNDRFLLYDIGSDDNDAKKPLAGYFNSYESRRIDAERKRVLYVALTRAINHLIITASAYSFTTSDEKESKKYSLYRIYKEALEKAGVNIRCNPIPYYETSELERAVSDAYDASWYGSAEEVKQAEYIEESIGVKEASTDDKAFCPDAEFLPDFPFSVDPVVMDGNLAADFGTVLHSALEEKLGGCKMVEYSNSRLSGSAVNAMNLSAREVAEDFTSSLFYKRFIEGRRTETEVRFYYPGPDDIVLIGSADLIVFSDDYNLVVDYKSDRYRNPDIHKGQLTLYAEAIENLYGKPCYAIICYLRDFSQGPLWDKKGDVVRSI